MFYITNSPYKLVKVKNLQLYYVVIIVTIPY